MKFKKFLVFLLIAALFIGTASALDISYQDGWSYGTYYCPHEGTAVAYHDSIQTTTEVYFSYTNANDLLKIETENNKGNYVGLDIKDLWYNEPTDHAIEGNSFDADLAVSSLPNNKIDYEDNGSIFETGAKDEIDVVALGTLELNKDYYFTALWDDLRDENAPPSGYDGIFSVNSELSEEWFDGEYNTIEWWHHANIKFTD